MARGFYTTYGSLITDRVASAYTGQATTQSWAFWAYDSGNAGGSNLGTLFDKRNSAIAGFRIFRVGNPTTRMEFYASWNSGANNLVDYCTRPSTGWHHWVITYDGGSTSNDAVIYVDGSSVTVTRFGAAPSGTLDTNSDNWCIGNYAGTAQRAWDGMIAEFGIWSAILTAAEAASLAKGFTPDQVRPASLVEYVPMVRDNVSRKNAAPTTTGALVQPHPRIIMPHRRGIRRFTTAVAGGGKPYYYYQQQGGM